MILALTLSGIISKALGLLITLIIVNGTCILIKSPWRVGWYNKDEISTKP